MALKKARGPRRTRLGRMINDHLVAVTGDDGQQACPTGPLQKPVPSRAETGGNSRELVDDECGRTFPEGLEGEKSRLLAVHELETLHGMGQGSGRIVLQPDLPKRDQLLGLRPALAEHALAPQCRRDARHRRGDDQRGCHRQPASTSAAPGKGSHGGCKSLFGAGQAAGIAFAPDAKLPIGRPGPQRVVAAALIVPGFGGLAELVAELSGIGVLGLPAHQAWPVGEQRLVDDLHAAGGLAVLFPNFVRRE